MTLRPSPPHQTGRVKRPGRWIAAGVLVIILGLAATRLIRASAEARREDRWVQYWAEKYSTYDTSDNALAAVELQRMGARAVPVLVRRLGHHRPAAVEHLRDFLAAHLTPKLATGLGLGPNPANGVLVRMRAAAALALIGPEARAAVPALTRALADADPQVSEGAIYALGEIGGPGVPVLVGQLTMREPRLRQHVVYALGQTGASGGPALPALVDLEAHDPFSFVRVSASNSWWKLAHSAPAMITGLLFSTRPAERAAAAHTINAVMAADPRVTRRLLELARDADPGVRMEAIGSLRRLVNFHPEAIPVLTEALTDAEGKIRQLAREGIGRAGSRAAAAVPALLAGLKDADPAAREATCVILGRLGTNAGVAQGPLAELRNDPVAEVRVAAATALRAVDGPVH